MIGEIQSSRENFVAESNDLITRQWVNLVENFDAADAGG